MTLPTAGQAADATAATPSSSVTDFTVMIDLSRMPAAWWADVDTSDGTRGRAGDGAGAEYAVDWIDFDDVAETGWARVLVTGTHSSVSGETVRMYAPNTRNAAVAASATYGSDNAYDADWGNYWPLHDTSDRVGGHTLTVNGSATLGVTAGKVGGAAQFTGSGTDFLSTTANAGFTEATIMWWQNVPSSAATFAHFIWWDASNRILGKTFYSLVFGGTSFNAASDWRDGVTKHVAITVNSSGGTDQYIDGLLDTSVTLAGPSPGTAGLEIGNDGMDGWLDDMQVQTSVRSAAWIDHEYDQTNDNATFWGTWAAVTLGGGSNIPAIMHHRRQLRRAA